MWEKTVDNSFGYLVEVSSISLGDQATGTWIQAAPLGKYSHPVYGEINITPERAQRFASNVVNKVREIDLDIDYDHKEKTTEAAGWVKNAEARSDGLWIFVEWTSRALQLLKDKAYRYFSPELMDEWEHPKTKQKYKDVLAGGGLTNRPFLKDILPINLSEVVNEGGNVMDPKQIRKLLKLNEDATDEEVTTALETAVTEKETEEGTETEEKKTETTTTVQASETKVDAATLKLAESDPMVKALVERIFNLETANRMSEVNQRLSEISQGSVVIAPAVLDKVRTTVLSAPKQAGDNFIALLSELTANGGLVQLGEKGSTGTSSTESGGAVKSFTDKVEAARKANDKLTYSDALEMVAADDPQLYNEYRNESYLKEGAR
ncbi:MAG: phage protease [Ilumatobacteraceae bacterium]